MKDYRTWWRIIHQQWMGVYRENLWCKVVEILEELPNDINTIDCMIEQLWAIQKGLAD